MPIIGLTVGIFFVYFSMSSPGDKEPQ